MCSFQNVLLLVAAVLTSASAQSVCQTGWTQAPSSSEAWSSKCYRNFGPTAADNSVPLMNGLNYTDCKAQCKNDSATARMLCLASDVETNFVAKQQRMKGWIAFTQDSSRSDYVEPAGGWGWECGSTYVPTWERPNGDVQEALSDVEPDNQGDGGEASCATLRRDGTIKDRSCQEGGDLTPWSQSALLGLLPSR